MNFKDFFKEQEILDQKTENWVTDPLKFAGGVGGNLIGQTLRGVGNTGAGVVNAASGLGDIGMGALQRLTGSKDKAKKRLSRGISNFSSGGKQIARGAGQIGGAWTGITPVLRGAQAVDDKSIGGVLAPNDPKRNYWQDLFGLDSGEQPTKQKNVEPSDKEKPVAISNNKEKETESDQGGWDQDSHNLADKIRKEKNPRRRQELITLFSNKYPILFRKIQVNQRRGRPSRDPAGLMRPIGPQVSPWVPY